MMKMIVLSTVMGGTNGSCNVIFMEKKQIILIETFFFATPFSPTLLFAPLPTNRLQKDVYICKDACRYMRRYTYLHMCRFTYLHVSAHVRLHINKQTNIQQHKNLGTHTHKQNPLSNTTKEKINYINRSFLKTFHLSLMNV